MNYARRRRSSADVYLMRTAWREAAFLHLLLAFGGICGIAGSEFSCTTGYGWGITWVALVPAMQL